MKIKKLSIVIPVYNEEKTLEKIIDKVQKVNLGKIKKELIMVDDFSMDGSAKVIEKIKKKYRNVKSFRHKENMGKGAALRTGFKHISGDVVVVQDSDLEYNPEEFKRMIKLILEDKTKVVYGSRLIGKSKGFKVLSHYYGNKFLSLLTKLLYNADITDMETCYKMMSREVIDSLSLKSDKFDIEPEITSKIIKKGYKIIEIPIEYKGRSFAEGKKINWKDGIKAIWVLFYWRFKDSNK